MFTVDGFFYNAWFSDGLSLNCFLVNLCEQKKDKEKWHFCLLRG